MATWEGRECLEVGSRARPGSREAPSRRSRKSRRRRSRRTVLGEAKGCRQVEDWRDRGGAETPGVGGIRSRSDHFLNVIMVEALIPSL